MRRELLTQPNVYGYEFFLGKFVRALLIREETGRWMVELQDGNKGTCELIAKSETYDSGLKLIYSMSKYYR